MRRKDLSFGDALEYLKSSEYSGEKIVTIEGWYGSKANPVVKLQVPDENSKMTEPYLYMEKMGLEGKLVLFPLDLSCESILSNKWMIV